MTVPYEFMMTTHLFLHTNNYQPDVLKAAFPKRSEWIDRVQRQFDEVLQMRPVTVDWYAEHANELFDDEETLYRYLNEVYDYVFRNGPWPVTES
jgi:predicted nucleotidyltransferase